MRYDAFLARVGEIAGVDRLDAAVVAEAVLRTFSERIGPKESKDTASQLPKPLQDAFQPGTAPQRFGASEFVQRVARRLDVDTETARDLSRAVFATLQEAISPGEFEDYLAYLTTDYVDLGARYADTGLTPRGASPDSHARGAVIGPNEFLRRVGDRAGLDEPRARSATWAVMETFGERIADGEARDLAAQLPEPAAEPLLRPGGDPQPIPLHEFVNLVSEREREPDFIAREHARAVLTTVREAVTADEWRDTIDELPKEYDALLV
jgi:uncharacterized protein (DUF2267 family)